MTKINNLKQINPSKYEFKLDKKGNLELILYKDAILTIDHYKSRDIVYQIEPNENNLEISISIK